MGNYRSLTEDEWIRHQEIKDQAFSTDEGPPTYNAPTEMAESTAERRGYFVDQELVSVCSLYSFSARLHNAWRPLGGIGGVATPPQHRSEGYARELLAGVLSEFADQEVPYSALWPVSFPYYRSYGWELAHLQTQYEFAPEVLQGLAKGSTGTFSRVSPTEYDQLAPIYEDAAEKWTLAFKRSPEWWQQQVLDDRWTYCWTPPDAENPEGYLVYTVETETENEMILEIEELIYQTRTARQQLLQFVYRHAPQIDRIRWTCPHESRLLTTVATPDQVDCSIIPGAMFRIVDVETALQELVHRKTQIERQVTLRVTDPLVDTNTADFTINTSKETMTCHRGSSSSDAIAVDIGTLSQLLIGATTVTEAVANENLRSETPQKEALEALLPSNQVYMADHF